MKTRVRHVWEIATSGYWFVPSVMTVAAGVSAFALLYIDRTYLGPGVSVGWLYSGGSEGAKTLLSTVAGSVITVAGVVFSITIAALTQASSQFGPRLLRNFMRDFSNQVVLGTFVATFLYCLLVLRTIHGKVEDGSSFVPQASVTGAVLLAIASIAVLIYFIHHISLMLQAPNIVAAVRSDFARVMDQMGLLKQVWAEPRAAGDASSQLPPGFAAGCCVIHAAVDGYVQAVDYDELFDIACKADLVLRLDRRPGEYATAGNALLRAWPAGRCHPQLQKRLNAAVICGSHRTNEQDVEYALRQMSEIAVRALSPAINDPFTAINCIDALGSAICRVTRTGLRGPCRYDPSGTLRLVTSISTFEGIVDTAFDQIRQYGRESVAVTIRLLEVINACAQQATTDDQKQVLLRHAQMIYRQSQLEQSIPEALDRQDVRHRWETVARSLGIVSEKDLNARGT